MLQSILCVCIAAVVSGSYWTDMYSYPAGEPDYRIVELGAGTGGFSSMVTIQLCGEDDENEDYVKAGKRMAPSRSRANSNSKRRDRKNSTTSLTDDFGMMPFMTNVVNKGCVTNYTRETPEEKERIKAIRNEGPPGSILQAWYSSLVIIPVDKIKLPVGQEPRSSSDETASSTDDVESSAARTGPSKIPGGDFEVDNFQSLRDVLFTVRKRPRRNGFGFI